jgi:hypothetical protein
LENPWIAASAKFLSKKALCYQEGEDQAFPNFSLAVLGDFNGLERKKFGNRSPRTLLSVYPSVASQPAIASYVANYNRSGGFEEEFCSIKPLLPLRLRRISSLIS